MHRVTPGALLDLLAATEAVGQHDRFDAAARTHRGKQLVLADLLGQRLMLVVKAERSRHAAASRIEQFPFHAELVQQRRIALHTEQRLLMTMPVHDHVRCKLRPLERLTRDEIGKQKRLRR